MFVINRMFKTGPAYLVSAETVQCTTVLVSGEGAVDEHLPVTVQSSLHDEAEEGVGGRVDGDDDAAVVESPHGAHSVAGPSVLLVHAVTRVQRPTGLPDGCSIAVRLYHCRLQQQEH